MKNFDVAFFGTFIFVGIAYDGVDAWIVAFGDAGDFGVTYIARFTTTFFSPGPVVAADFEGVTADALDFSWSTVVFALFAVTAIGVGNTVETTRVLTARDGTGSTEWLDVVLAGSSCRVAAVVAGFRF